MNLQGQDGELRIVEWGNVGTRVGTTYYLEILFCEMDFSAATSRPRAEERLILDRNKADTNMHYALGPDTPRYEPIPLTFSARIQDTTNSWAVSEWLSGSSNVYTTLNATDGVGTTVITSWAGKGAAGTGGTIDGNTLPDFAADGDPNLEKMTYRVEIRWDGASKIGYQYNQVHFTPGENTITESPDGLIINANAQVYGDVTRIADFTAGYTSIHDNSS